MGAMALFDHRHAAVDEAGPFVHAQQHRVAEETHVDVARDVMAKQTMIGDDQDREHAAP